MAYMTRTGARSTRYPLSGLGCGCSAVTPPVAGMGDDTAQRAGAGLALLAGTAGLLWLLSTSKLAMNRRKPRSRRRRASSKRRRSTRRRRSSSPSRARLPTSRTRRTRAYIIAGRNLSRAADPFARLTATEHKLFNKTYTNQRLAKKVASKLSKRHPDIRFEVKLLGRRHNFV